IATLGVDIPVRRRDPHYFLPTPGPVGSPYLWCGTDREATRRQLREVFSADDLAADDALAAELAALRDDLAPAWLAEPLPVEETAQRYVRPQLRQTFVDLVRGSVVAYLDRFGFRSELLQAMYAVTDGITGVHAGPDDPGTGHNFLVHNMCRLPGSDGTWMVAVGGMGTVARVLADAARAAGARLVTGAEVAAVRVGAGAVEGVALADGRAVAAWVVLGACDPYRLIDLVGAHRLPGGLVSRVAGVRRPGSGAARRARAPRAAPPPTCGPPRSPAARRCRRRGRGGRRSGPAGCRPSPRSSGTSTPPSTRRCGTPAGTTPRRCSCRRCRTSPRARPGRRRWTGTWRACWRCATGTRPAPRPWSPTPCP